MLLYMKAFLVNIGLLFLTISLQASVEFQMLLQSGDGKNDILYVRESGVSQLNFIVYDRWGEKVFETQDENIGWDGTFHGQKLDPGVFAYYLRVIFVDATEKIEKGDITLVR